MGDICCLKGVVTICGRIGVLFVGHGAGGGKRPVAKTGCHGRCEINLPLRICSPFLVSKQKVPRAGVD